MLDRIGERLDPVLSGYQFVEPENQPVVGAAILALKQINPSFRVK